MGTTAQKLHKVLETKNLIKAALIEKGVDIAEGDSFASYADKIGDIQSASSAEIVIESDIANALFDVTFINSAIQEETVQSLGVGTHKLPISTYYPVTVKPKTVVTGKGLPRVLSKNVTYDKKFVMNYLPTGFYLQDINFELYTYDEWVDKYGTGSNSEYCNAIVYINNQHSVCVSHNKSLQETEIYGTYGTLVDRVYTTTDTTLASYDYAGLSNTLGLVEAGSPAALFCRTSISRGGQSGYLPALGELRLIQENWNSNFNLIQNMSNICGTYLYTFTSYDFCEIISSTQCDKNRRWGSRWYENTSYIWSPQTYQKTHFYEISVDSDYQSAVSAFCPLLTPIDLKEIVINSNVSSALFTIEYTDISGGSVKIENLSAGIHKYPINNAMSVTITPNKPSGYYELGPVTQIPGENNIFNFEFGAPGVFIRHINGNEYTSEEWESNNFANSVADCVVVRTQDHVVAIALDYHAADIYWGGYSKSISGIVSTEETEEAVLDFNGATNTTKIISTLSGYNDGYATGAPAAEWCNSFRSPSGLQGYMPAAGEAKIIMDNSERVVEAMQTCGGVWYEDTNLWTSTENDYRYSWVWNFYEDPADNTLNYKGRKYDYPVWPFLKLN